MGPIHEYDGTLEQAVSKPPILDVYRAASCFHGAYQSRRLG